MFEFLIGGIFIDEKMNFNKDKFKDLIHYIANKFNSNGISKLSLVKIAYFSDFNFYDMSGMPISGEIYIREENGPVAIHFDEVMEELINEGKIKSTTQDYGIGEPIISFTSLTDPNANVFSLDEIKTIDESIGLPEMDSRLVGDDDLLLHSSIDVSFNNTYGDIIWDNTALDDIIYYYPEQDDEGYMEYVANTHKAIKQVEEGNCESMSPEEFLEELENL